MTRNIVASALILALGAFGLQWLEHRQLMRQLAPELFVLVIALAFTAGGLWVGWTIAARRRGPGFARNEAAIASLGLTRQEMRVLERMASGGSNKDLARELGLSPNTIKTHLSNLFAKLEASTRTQAVSRARELEIIP